MEFDRAAPNGTGAAKVEVETMLLVSPGKMASRVFSDVIYLGPLHTKIEEVGSSQLFGITAWTWIYYTAEVHVRHPPSTLCCLAERQLEYLLRLKVMSQSIIWIRFEAGACSLAASYLLEVSTWWFPCFTLERSRSCYVIWWIDWYPIWWCRSTSEGWIVKSGLRHEVKKELYGSCKDGNGVFFIVWAFSCTIEKWEKKFWVW